LQETVTLKVENPEGGVLTWEVILFQPSEIETCEDGDPPGRYKTFLLCCGWISKETLLRVVSTVAIPIFCGAESFQTKHFSVDTVVTL